MTRNQGNTFYSPALLQLASELANHPLDKAHAYQAHARTRSCGSTIAIGLELDPGGTVSKVGLRVSACALGQASAAIFARAVIGKSEAQIAAASDQIARWLEAEADCPVSPDWPGFAPLEPARAHKGRHEALRLPWQAALSALSKPALAS